MVSKIFNDLKNLLNEVMNIALVDIQAIKAIVADAKFGFPSVPITRLTVRFHLIGSLPITWINP